MLGRQRDIAVLRDGLTSWLARWRPGATDHAVTLPSSPKAGFSNETYLVDASWRRGGAVERMPLVVRLVPTDFRVFPEYDLTRQARVMQCLAEGDVPVPRVLALEAGETPLGEPFYVMERIAGEVPSEVPPYHAFGLCADATPERRAQMWWSGLETLARIHAVDWRRHGLDFLGVPGGGTDPVDRQLAYYARYLEWVRRGQPQPILAAALAWLERHRHAPARVTLCWGDSRLPNLIFRDDRVAAVLDWEMAFLGDPEADLGWWLFLDWAQSEGYGIPRLAGFPGPDETIARYESLTGRPVAHARWHEVFAALRFGVIMARIAGRMREMNIPAPTEDFERDNVCTRRLAELLGLPPPGGADRPETSLADVTARVQFHLSGPGARSWFVAVTRGAAARFEGEVADAEVTVTASATDWEAIERGELNRAEAFLSGRLKVAGDLSLLARLEETIARLR